MTSHEESPGPRPTDPWALTTDLMRLLRGRCGITRWGSGELAAAHRATEQLMADLSIPAVLSKADRDSEAS